jgi:hypothetical protein
MKSIKKVSKIQLNFGLILHNILLGRNAPTDANNILNWNFKEPTIEWFKGCKLNITENCLDRHLEKDANTPAIIWEPNDPEDHHRVLTYQRTTL